MKKQFLALILGLSFSGMVQAQSDAKAQVSFVYPLGSSGIHSLSEVHNFSFNILVGLNGGLNGFELGSLLNYNNADVQGFQMAGLSNINMGNLNGFQSAGLFNLNLGSSGAVIAGLGNLNLGRVEGINMAGLFNMASESQGIAIAGLSNLNLQKFQGIQMSGILNLAKHMEGFQIGMINRSRSLGSKENTGFQLGLVNIVDSASEGYSLGLINIINKGYYAFELSSTEMLYSNLQFKMGVEKLYSFVSLGYGSFDQENTLGLGLGLGSLYNWNEKHGTALEFGFQHLRNDFDGPDNYAFWTSARLNYQYHLTEVWSLSGGLSFNHYRSDEFDEAHFARVNSALELNSSVGPEAQQKAWIGFNLGIISRI
ncbi:hypothetical protein [Croceimicrobium hydrocarbonivorans]|uniref:Uncharacterized protein n=1 Tax=Croceimicrobium hydrocarbonivorans TaxID=2761580 RepID=A0A7H0VJT2_9FLAO|nr:hypothetical protein [Croceimicrobium hydrocarbonivorans]QNR25980.1 hypothetical protein H4K34_09090 [Croceimicrobium hydrocarbonivorans]